MDLPDVYLLHYRLLSFTKDATVVWVALAAILALFYISKPSKLDNVKIPIVTTGGPFLPKFYSRLRFGSCAPTIISEGYSKVRSLALLMYLI